MALDTNRIRKFLKEFDFKNLFVEELGWNHYNNQIEVTLDGNSFHLSAVAEKHGMAAFTCNPSIDGHIPNYELRRKIEKQAAKSIHEHIIIYTDKNKTTQIWQWVKREAGKPIACREHPYHINQPGDSLIQKLQSLIFNLEEEETLTIVDVAGRAKSAFDVERVTKKFYDRFKTEHDAFLKFIEGIPDDELHRWYASVMLNRLMFIYFIQSKGFLNNDTNYLKNKLTDIKQTGKNLFYKKLLCPLFFEGFAKKASERSSAINKLLGEIPYLNGGLFLKHQIEELHGRHIEIADKAFEKLFEFFDIYHWHLDERLLRKDNEINPDVLGYIFEKYINQKQMGAYYTQEDITGSISKNTIIPFIFDVVRKNCGAAFEGENSIWKLLKNDPDRYIYDAVKLGVIDENRDIIPESILPDFVQKGMHDPKARMFDRRYNLGGADLQAHNGKKLTLPTETWREYVERRNRCLELRNKLLNGDVCNINNFITYNLNILQFAQDVIENCEEPELLRAFWRAIEQLKALDPTCGSGAFIFAVLNILELLYEACLQRMQIFLDELERSGEKHRADKYGDFKKILKRVEDHHNPRYFIYKSIIINNLYGVDIMEEAVEICKLRLFLKLVAQVDRVEDIEPLPDIDFNIRVGNTLVGFATYDEVKEAVTSKLDFENTMERIEEQAEDIDRLFKLFRKMQTDQGMDSQDFINAKQELRSRLKALEDELNRYLAGEYGIDSNSKTAYKKWLTSHKPFHWFIEFYGILKSGGFDVNIGNPPYVEYSKIRSDYTLLSKQYKTESTGNLYSFIVERSQALLNKDGSLGMILPLSAFCTQRMTPLIGLIKEKKGSKWISHFGWRPAKLFEGVNIPLSILITKPGPTYIYTTTFIKWYNEYRFAVFPNIRYINSSDFIKFDHVIPKIGSSIELSILGKVFLKEKCINDYKTRAGENGATFFYRNTGGLYWRIFTDFQPLFSQNGSRMSSSTESTIEFSDRDVLNMVTGVVNSNLYWLFYVIYSPFHHVNPCDILEFPVDFAEVNIAERKKLIHSSEKLMEDMQSKSEIRQRIHKGGHTSKIQTFIPSLSKHLNDDIDRLLRNHYALTDDELDYIINYDIKYRMSEIMEEE